MFMKKSPVRDKPLPNKDDRTSYRSWTDYDYPLTIEEERQRRYWEKDTR
jgi:hypothetical protein